MYAVVSAPEIIEPALAAFCPCFHIAGLHIAKLKNLSLCKRSELDIQGIQYFLVNLPQGPYVRLRRADRASLQQNIERDIRGTFD